MPVNNVATETTMLSSPIAFRLQQSRREILEAFAREDGHDSLAPILRKAADLYIHTRIRHGAAAVRIDGK